VSLGIGSASRVTDKGLLLLAELPHLQQLSANHVQGISAAGLLRFCRTAKAIEAVDAEGCEYTPKPTQEELHALQLWFGQRPYEFTGCDNFDAGDDDETSRVEREAEIERLERESRERAAKERKRREREREERMRLELERRCAADLHFILALTKAVESIGSWQDGDGKLEASPVGIDRSATGQPCAKLDALGVDLLNSGPGMPEAPLIVERPRGPGYIGDHMRDGDLPPSSDGLEEAAAQTKVAAAWVVVGGGGYGIVVRERQGRKARELGLLKTGAKVEELEQVDGRLHYRMLFGEGPEEGWVSIEAKGKSLVVRV